MNLLALDLGTHCGWASLVQSEVKPFKVPSFLSDYEIESGVKDFALARGESPGLRFLAFRAWLHAMLALVEPQLVAYEQAHNRGGYATDLLIGMTTRVQEICAERKINYMPVHSGTLKKAMTGYGNASKEEMKAKAIAIFKKMVESDDEGDALLLLEYARQKIEGKEYV